MWPDDIPFLHLDLRLPSASVYNFMPYVQNRATRLSDVGIFKIYRAKILRKLNFLFRKTVSHFDFGNRRWPKFGYIAPFSKY